MAPKRAGTLRSKSSTPSPPRHSPIRTLNNGLIALRYEETVAAKPPIAVTVPPPRAPPTDTHPALRTRSRAGQHERDDKKRDSGLAPTTSSKAREGSVHTLEDKDNVLGVTINFNSSFNSSQPAPKPVQTPPLAPTPAKLKKANSSASVTRWRVPSMKKSFATSRTPPSAGASVEEEFSPITTPIPTDSLLDADFLNELSFSKRGSIMLGGKKPTVNGQLRQNGGRRYA
jgi:hypothetical protein